MPATGQEPEMMQDVSRDLFRWLANRIGARWLILERAARIIAARKDAA